MMPVFVISLPMPQMSIPSPPTIWPLLVTMLS